MMKVDDRGREERKKGNRKRYERKRKKRKRCALCSILTPGTYSSAEIYTHAPAT